MLDKNQELKRLQEKIIEERKQAALSTLAAGIAHEIRNPLIHILNFTNLFFEYLEEIQEELEETKTNLIIKSYQKIESLIEVAKSNSKETITQIKRIQQISELLSSIARQNKSKSLPTSLSMVGISKPTPANLNNLVDSILKITSYSKQFEREDFCIKIETNYDLTIGEKQVIIEDLTKVLINLVDNACDAVLEKKEKKGEEFQPTIYVSTRLLNKHLIEISV
jgi:signal transduction histidine kinase